MAGYRKIICTKFSTNFRDATQIITLPELPHPSGDDILVKNYYVGINASDINYTNGLYTPNEKPPLDCGFEAVGQVVGVGNLVKGFRIGDPVTYTKYGAFSEYLLVSSRIAHKVDAVVPEVLSVNVCGLTASIALDDIGQMRHGETVLVTAAAGATGQFAVQLAKLAGNHVIGTCSSDEKVEFLKSLGCDRPINYRKENLNSVLKEEYPHGVDLVFESVGGKVFDDCFRNIAPNGRIIVIGFISGYQDSSGFQSSTLQKPICATLLSKGASLRGFFLKQCTLKTMISHRRKLENLIRCGKLDPHVDSEKFIGLEAVANAVEYLFAGKNKGKVVVALGNQSISRL